MKPTRIAGALTALAAIAVLSGCGLTHHTEADARTVAAQARTTLADPALLPHVHRAAYQAMLRASNITIS